MWDKWDMLVKPQTEKLKGPKGEIKLEGFSGAVEFKKEGGLIIPCAFEPDLSHSTALARLKTFILKKNSELGEADFRLEFGWRGLRQSGYPKEQDIVFITKKGCTLGPPITIHQKA